MERAMTVCGVCQRALYVEDGPICCFCLDQSAVARPVEELAAENVALFAEAEQAAADGLAAAKSKKPTKEQA